MIRTGCALIALVVAMPAVAQDAPGPAAPQPVQGDAPVPPAAPAATPRTQGRPQTPAAGPRTPMADPFADDNEIVVTGGPERGSVPGDIPPERVLRPADIRAYGAASVGELLAQLEPQTRSGRGRGGGRPLLLLSGRRISSFRELRDIPSEAIERVEILPEEVALRYGYRADQRVINIVLRRRFNAFTGELADTLATDGGRNAYEVEVGLLRIREGTRLNINTEFSQSSALTEAERSINSDPLGRPAAAQARTLLPRTREFTFGGSYARPLGERADISANLRFDASDSPALLGLPAAGVTPLDRLGEGRTVIGGFAINGDALPWRWSIIGNYERTLTRSLTDRDPATAPPGFTRDYARSIATSSALSALVSGQLFALPAGDINTSLRISGTINDLDSLSTRAGITAGQSLVRQTGAAQANLDFPITRRNRDFLPFLGDLSVNVNLEVETLSDFGRLTTWGYGFVWSPVRAFRLIGSATYEEGAPSQSQLGNPVTVTPNVSVFDYVRGQTVDISRLDGGNPALRADSRSVYKLGATLRPIEETDLQFRIDYVNEEIDNPIAGFPAPTAEIQAAFPTRFVRDGTGRLIAIDNRGVNFARSNRQEIRWGVDFSRSLRSAIQRRVEAYREQVRQARERGEPPPPNPFAREFGQLARQLGQGRRQSGSGQTPAAGQGQTPPPDGTAPQPGQPPQGSGPPGGFRTPFGPIGPGGFGGPGGPGGGGFGGGRGQGGGRLQLGLYHTWRLQEEILIRPGVPVLDLLNGSAVGNSGGQPRHEVQFQAGYANNGIGLRAEANWQSATRVDGTGASPTLRFSDRATVNLRAFVNLGPQFSFVRQNPWLLGTRVVLSVDNVFNERQRVTDAAGATPVTYLPARIDPLGRTIRLSVRKLFF